MLGGYRLTSITILKMLGGYRQLEIKNMHHVNVVHVQIWWRNVMLLFKFSPNHSFTPQFTYRWLTHIVLQAAAVTMLTPIHHIKLTQQPLHITFLHHNPSRVQVYFRDLTCEWTWITQLWMNNEQFSYEWLFTS